MTHKRSKHILQARPQARRRAAELLQGYYLVANFLAQKYYIKLVVAGQYDKMHSLLGAPKHYLRLNCGYHSRIWVNTYIRALAKSLIL